MRSAPADRGAVNVEFRLLVHAEREVGDILEQSVLDGGGGDLLEAFDVVVVSQVGDHGPPGRKPSLAGHVRVNNLPVDLVVNAPDFRLGQEKFAVARLEKDLFGRVFEDQSLEGTPVVHFQPVGHGLPVERRIARRGEEAGIGRATDRECKKELCTHPS